MPAAATTPDAPSRLARMWANVPLRIVSVVVVVALAALAAWAIEGSAPKPASAGGPLTPPPLILRATMPAASLDAQGAKQLAAKHYDQADVDFGKSLDANANDVVAQVGEDFAQWASLGVTGEIAQLQQVLRDYPGNAYAQLSLGLVELYSGEATQAAQDLHTARTDARAHAADADIADRADDLLHPSLAPGYPPYAIPASDASSQSARRVLASFEATIVQHPLRVSEATLVRLAGASSDARIADPAVAAAAVIGGYDKDRAAQAVSEMRALSRRFPHSSTVALNRALIELWSGNATIAHRLLHTVAASASASSADRAQAGALVAALKH